MVMLFCQQCSMPPAMGCLHGYLRYWRIQWHPKPHDQGVSSTVEKEVITVCCKVEKQLSRADRAL